MPAETKPKKKREELKTFPNKDGTQSSAKSEVGKDDEDDYPQCEAKFTQNTVNQFHIWRCYDSYGILLARCLRIIELC